MAFIALALWVFLYKIPGKNFDAVSSGMQLSGKSAGKSLSHRTDRSAAYSDKLSRESAGESLFHGIDNDRLSWYMPMQSTLAGLVTFHAPSTAESMAAGWIWLSSLGLVFTLGRLLCSGTCGLLAILIIPQFPKFSEQSIYTLIFLILANLLAWRARAPSALRSAWVGVAIGLSLLTRSTLFLFPPSLAIVEWMTMREVSVRLRAQRILPMCLVPYLFLLPWLYMNYRIHGQIIPFEKNRADAVIVAGALGHVAPMGGNIEKAAVVPKDESVLFWAAREAIRHPMFTALGCLKRLEYIAFHHPILLALVLISAWVCRQREDHFKLILLAAYFVGVHCLIGVQRNYLTPLWPLCAVLVSSLVTQLIGSGQEKPAASASIAFTGACLAPILGMGMFALFLSCTYPERVAKGNAALEAAIAKYPADPWLLSERGRAHLEEGRPQLAVKDLAKASTLFPRKDMELTFAWALMVQGGPAKNMIQRVWLDGTTFETLENVRGRLLKMLSFLQQGRLSEARQTLGAAQRLWWLEFYAKSEVATSQSQPVRAIPPSVDIGLRSMLPSLMAPFPLDKQLIILIQFANMRQLDFDPLIDSVDLGLPLSNSEKALNELKNAETMVLSPKNLRHLAQISGQMHKQRQALQSVAKIYTELKQHQHALALLGPLLEREPANIALWADLAKAAHGAGEHDIAAKASIKLEKPPKPLVEWLRLSPASRPGKLTLDIERLAHAESTTPEESDQIAVTFQEMKEYRRALRILDNLIRAHPSKAKYLSDRGVVKALMGKYREAALDFRAAIYSDPDFLPAYLTLGGLLSITDRTAEALIVYDQALGRRVLPTDTAIRLRLETAREFIRFKREKDKKSPRTTERFNPQILH